METVKIIEHRGVEIIYLDFSCCSTRKMFEIMEEAKKVIRKHQLHSALTLTNVEGSRYNLEAVAALKEFTSGNKPFVRTGAFIGLDGMKRVIYEGVMRFSGRKLPVFDDIEKAKDWLVEQKGCS